MAKYYKGRGIVLHTVKYGESSMIAYLFTDVGGRTTYMIQGAYGSRKGANKGALFQPLFLLEFEGVEQPHAAMHRMREMKSLYTLSSLPFDVRKSTISLFIAEVLYRLVREEEANEPLFDFICSTVLQLDAMADGIANFHLWFLVQLSAFLGFYPGNEYQQGDYFDIRSGVFCRSMPSHNTAMERVPAAMLGRLMECETEELQKLALSRTQRAEFMEAMIAFFGYHFDSIHAINSIKILKEVF